jgi:hypothetical protein
MAGAVVLVVGDVPELTTETVQLSLGCVFINLVPPSNLRNAIT